MTQQSFNPDDVTKQLLEQMTLDTTAGFLSPLRHFTGTLVNIKSRYQQSRTSNNTMVILTFQFGQPNFRVMAAAQPYQHPTGELEFVVFDPSNIRDNSPTGVLLGSAKKCLNDQSGFKLIQLIGKHLEVMYTKEHLINMRIPGTESYEDKPVDAFEVLAVDNQRNPTPHKPWNAGETQQVAQTTTEPTNTAGVSTAEVNHTGPDFLLEYFKEPKTLREFKSAAFTDSRVQQDAGLFNEFASDSINARINGWVGEGMLSRQGEGEEAVYSS